jgi:hypothetical protein
VAEGSEVAQLPDLMNVCGVEIGYPLLPCPLPRLHPITAVPSQFINYSDGANYTQRTVIMRARADYTDVQVRHDSLFPSIVNPHLFFLDSLLIIVPVEIDLMLKIQIYHGSETGRKRQNCSIKKILLRIIAENLYKNAILQ